jgi:hypothetical protein
VDGGQQLAGILAAADGGLLVAPFVVIAPPGQAVVADPAVGDHAASGLDVAGHERAEGGAGCVSQHGHPAPADAFRLADLHGDAGQDLLAGLAPAAQAVLLSADECLVRFYGAGEPVPAGPHER